MKQYFLFISLILFAFVVLGQTPQTLNYQGVARNAAGQPYANANIHLRLSIRSGASNGPAAYVETRSVTTNAQGLFTVVINSAGATSQTGSFSDINWAQGTKFLQTEIDPAGGNNFLSIGNTQMQSSPFALMAAKSQNLVFPRTDYFNNSSSSVWYLENAGSTTPLFLKNSGTGAAFVASATSGSAVSANTQTSLTSRGAIDGSNTGTAGFGVRGTANNSNSIGVEAVNGAGLALSVNGRLRIAGGNTNPGVGRVLTSDASGNATWQAPPTTTVNKVGFSVRGVAGGGLQAIPNNQWYKLHGGYEEFDADNNYTMFNQGTVSNPSSSFTAPISGFYNFSANITLRALSGSLTRSNIKLMVKRGNNIFELANNIGDEYESDPQNRYISPNLTINTPLLVGDQVWVEVLGKTSNGTNPQLVLEPNYAANYKQFHSFSGYLIFAN